MQVCGVLKFSHSFSAEGILGKAGNVHVSNDVSEQQGAGQGQECGEPRVPSLPQHSSPVPEPGGDTGVGHCPCHDAAGPRPAKFSPVIIILQLYLCKKYEF